MRSPEAGKTGAGKRYGCLDSLRGAALCSMILYHALWDLVYIFNVNINWYSEGPGYVWQQSICWTFIFLSGFCQPLGSRQIRRGLVVFGAGMLIWLVTALFMPEQTIRFGVLTLIGSSMVITALLKRTGLKINTRAGFICSVALFLLTRNVNTGSLGFESLNIAVLPDRLYRNDFTAWLGFPGEGFSSADYFSLVPWFFLFSSGYFLCVAMKERGLLRKLPDISLPPLNFMGKHSLGIYMIHQPLIYFILTLYFAF